MIYDKIYNQFVVQLSRHLSETWPEYAFIMASWKDLAENIDSVYKSLSELKNPIPEQVRLGYFDSTKAGGSLPKCEECPEGMQIPFLFDWCSYRGLNVYAADIDGDGDVAPMNIVRKVAASMLLRLQLYAEPGSLLIHKVDIKGMGADMAMLPQQPNAPIITSMGELNQLIAKLREQLSRHPVDAMTWKVDVSANTYSTDVFPLQIIFIADWDDLYERRGGECRRSEIQNTILDMMKTDVCARNGIYFVICSDVEDSRDFSEHIPSLAIDDMNEGGSADDRGYRGEFRENVKSDRPCHQFYSVAYFRFYLPTDDEIKAVHSVHRSFISGTLTDEEGQGLWKGNSAKGLRAIMGITGQGDNQFFELGVGQAFDAFHALVGGATGSGKSVLLREIICSLAERYSPQELRMLLLDYKEGTEFAPFEKLPHVYALSIGSNPEFGLEVLKETQKEIVRRGQLFKDAGNAKNLEEYRRLTGETLCRYVLVADEFQVLLTDKKYGEEAKTVLNDLVRRGRAFGFNAILSTQTLRDGALDGEAKNQFACRIAMRMAESETEYFLGSENNIPASFTRKGQAVLNYALGRKESNILFQSGNKEMPKKFRDTKEVEECLQMLYQKAIDERCLPSDVYVYNSDGYGKIPANGIDHAQGLLIGMKNDMKSTPVYLSARQLSGKVLVLGGTQEKRENVLSFISSQLSELYNIPVIPQSPGEWLDAQFVSDKVAVWNVDEGDFDLEDAVIEWKEMGEKSMEVEASPSASDIPEMVAPEGLEAEFADLMKQMEANNSMLATSSGNGSVRQRRGARSNRDSRCLVLALASVSDLKLMEACGLYQQDFRVVLYLDVNSYNQTGGYDSITLGDSNALIECPRGVVSKIRLIK